MTARLTEEKLDEILSRDFTSSFRRGYVKVKGTTMPKRFEELQDEIYNWDVRDEDIWICSFPKTVSYTPYWSHLMSFWQHRNQENLLFLKYEDMNKDLPSVIKRVANFLQKPLSEEQVQILYKHLSFENMKKNPAVNYEMVISINRKYKLTQSEGKFMRSGKVGDYKANMSPEIIKAFDEWSEQNLKDTDFSF
nr:unnamed protein product [Callosobruchus analis]